MSKRKPMDKAQARERRNRLLDAAAAAELSLTEGVREMRAISGMTQEEFAKHRGVSARVIKAIELEQGNPTVGTLNRIGEFFGLEVAFVPVRRKMTPAAESQPDQALREIVENSIREELERRVNEVLNRPDMQVKLREHMQNVLSTIIKPADTPAPQQASPTPDAPCK